VCAWRGARAGCQLGNAPVRYKLRNFLVRSTVVGSSNAGGERARVRDAEVWKVEVERCWQRGPAPPCRP
jgi:hypothetical protein